MSTPKKSKSATPRPRLQAKPKPKAPASRATRAVPKRAPSAAKMKTARGRPIGSSSVSTSRRPTTVTSGSNASGHYLRVRGTEFITQITVPSTEVANTVYLTNRNTVMIPGTRLIQYAEIYERWHPREWRYKFIPSVPTTTPGAYIMCQDPDPLAAYITGASENSARARALENSRMHQFWQAGSCDIPKSGDYTSLWCTDPSVLVTEGDRLDLAGSFAMIAAVPSALASGTVLGILELEYEVDFFVPHLDPAATEHEITFMGKVNQNFEMVGPVPRKILNAAILGLRVGLASGTVRGLSAAVLSLLRDYTTVEGVTPEEEGGDAKEEKPPGATTYVEGWYDAKIMNIDLWLMSNVSLPLVGPTITSQRVGTSFYTGNATGGPVTTPRFASDGVLYSYVDCFSTQYGASNRRCWRDFLVTAPNAIPTDCVFELRIYEAGAPLYVNTLTAGTMTVCRKVNPFASAPARTRVLGIPAERKETKLVVAQDVEDIEDCYDPSPPSTRLAALISSAPGGSAYTPGVPTLSKAPRRA